MFVPPIPAERSTRAGPYLPTGIGRADAGGVNSLIIACSAFAGGLAGTTCVRLLRRGVRAAPVAALPCAAATALLWVIAVARWHGGELPGSWLPALLGLTTLAVPLVAADLRHHRLPDVLTLSSYPVFAVLLGIAATATPDGALAWRAVAGAVLFAAAHAAVHVASPRSMGAGDVKLSGVLGAVLGALGWTALFSAAIVAAVVTVLLAVYSLRGRVGGGRTGVPHGPGMLIAAWLLSSFPAAGYP